ncbi:MAG TPA: hypothetical protein VGP55_10935 [Chitinophagaceae bacterium]|nr:hypothetical protein [Chitinophagaceae bacterium]
MELINLLAKVNPDILIVLFTALFAFLSWIIKGLMEKPLEETKNTFNKFFEQRIEILAKVKARLAFIAYFPSEEHSKEFKEELQQILLKDGKIGYLDKETFESVLKISIEPKTDEKFLIGTIQQIDADLCKQISKIHDEISFYRKFSNYNPFKRFIGFTILSLQYILSLSLIIGSLYFVTYELIVSTWYWKILVILGLLLGLYLINNWFKK